MLNLNNIHLTELSIYIFNHYNYALSTHIGAGLFIYNNKVEHLNNISYPEGQIQPTCKFKKNVLKKIDENFYPLIISILSMYTFEIRKQKSEL